MDALLKSLADISLALASAEEALDEAANTNAREHLDAADEGLARLRSLWPDMGEAERTLVGRAASPLRERADSARKRLPRLSALTAVEPTPEELEDASDDRAAPGRRMSAPDFDLQSHSVVSDGALEPAAVVAAAAAAGVKLLALTDHDSIDGVGEAMAAGEQHGIDVVPAAELSAIDGDREDLHICGYAFDHKHPHLVSALEEFREDRAGRGDRMADALIECGFELDRAPLQARSARPGSPIGRPHLAEAVLAHPANAARLAEEELTDVGGVIVAYLIAGAPAYRRRTTPTVEDAIALIHEAGGLAVWAHPFWDVDADDEVLRSIDRFTAAGLDGVEAFYITHDERQTRLLVDHCKAEGLLTTGSADFHGPDHKLFHTFRAFETYDLVPDLGPIATPSSYN